MASNAARGVADAGGETFREVWKREIYPAIKDEYEELLNTVPLRMRAKQEKRVEKKRQVRRQGERGHHSEQNEIGHGGGAGGGASAEMFTRTWLGQVQVTTRVCR